MENKIIKRVQDYQNLMSVHSLTCDNDSMHKDLVPIIINGEEYLRCLDCNYIQKVPEWFYDDSIDEFIEQQQKIDEILMNNLRENFV